jgi:hypothetical protein
MFRTSIAALLLMASALAQAESRHVVFDAAGTEQKLAVAEIQPALPADWDSFHYLVFEMKASTPQRVRLSIHTAGGARSIWFHPFAGAWIRTAVPLVRLDRPEQSGVDLAAMSNKPRALSFVSGAHGQGPLKAVQAMGWKMTDPVGDAKFEFRSISLTKEDPGDAVLDAKPLVDEFGQWIGENWQGKAASLGELQKAWAEEVRSLQPIHKLEVNGRFSATQTVEANGGYDYCRYGGYTSSHAKATGFFRVEKIEGKWWFVDPDGHLFLSVGSDVMQPGMGTSTLDRASIFAALPPVELNRAVPRDEGRGLASFYSWNLSRRYGADWKKQWVDFTLRRMAAWGFNTIGNWSDPELWAARRTPYAMPLDGWGMEQYMGMPDVYSPAWLKQVDEAAKRQCAPRKADPWLLGYFIANEPAWPGREVLVADLILKGPDTATKKALQALLAKENTPQRKKAFMLQCFEKELAAINAGVKKYDPNHLNLGIRFGGQPEDEIVRMTRNFDVYSQNIYSEVPDRAQLDKLYALTGLPMIIGEFHMGTPGRGMSAGLVQAKDQAERGVAYRYYVEQAVSMPALIGTHWFQWIDEPNTGRMDGENYNIGFIDVTDRPYSEFVEAAQQTHKRLFAVHSLSEKPFSTRAARR